MTRKFLSSSPWVVCAVILLTSVITFLVPESCRKFNHQRLQTDNTERFLTVSPTAHPAVKKVVDMMRKLNNSRQFINPFVARQGFAIWDKSVVVPVNRGNYDSRTQAEDYSLLIPLVWDHADLVHAAIAAKVTEDSVFFTLLDGSNHDTYNADSASRGMNGRQLSATLMYLDNLVFGHTLFRITDSAAFPNKGHNVKYVEAPDSIIVNPSAERTVIVSFLICFTTWVPPHGGQLVGCPPGDPNCNGYVPVTNCDWYNVIADDG